MDVFSSALRGNELIDGSKAVQVALRKFNMDLQDETVADAVSIIPGLATIVGTSRKPERNYLNSVTRPKPSGRRRKT